MSVRVERGRAGLQRVFTQAHGPYDPDVICDRGEGIYLFDQDGKRYIDFSGGAMVAGIGHGDQRITEAVVAQMKKVSYFYRGFWISEPLAELAERLIKVAPPNMNTVQFANSGSEATETAIKLAHQYHLEKGNQEKTIVISRWQDYHGMTLGAMAVSGLTARRKKFGELVPTWPKIPAPLCYRCAYGLSYPGCNVLCARALEEVINQVGPEYVSAFIVEPIGGASTGGMVPVPEYYRIVRETCDRHDVLLIDDEVICGLGRTGKWFGLEHWGVRADMMLMAKGMTGGYATLSAVLVDEGIGRVFGDRGAQFIHGFTMEANPVACAAASGVLDIIVKEGLVERSARLGEYLHRGAKERFSRHACVGDIRGKGLYLGVEMVKNKETKEPFERSVMASYVHHAIAKQKGCMTYPGTGVIQGVLGDHFLVAPPYIITEEQIDAALDILDESFSVFEKMVGM